LILLLEKFVHISVISKKLLIKALFFHQRKAVKKTSKAINGSKIKLRALKEKEWTNT